MKDKKHEEEEEDAAICLGIFYLGTKKKVHENRNVKKKRFNVTILSVSNNNNNSNNNKNIIPLSYHRTEYVFEQPLQTVVL
jgi:hypothetical protein